MWKYFGCHGNWDTFWHGNQDDSFVAKSYVYKCAKFLVDSINTFSMKNQNVNLCFGCHNNCGNGFLWQQLSPKCGVLQCVQVLKISSQSVEWVQNGSG